ncbi:MAG TPA: hypothetical protein VKB17_07115 [Thermoleophilaceae bacterium]|nr:hypothetical protein [Thermoleophilaceae bacterium]
MRLGFWPEIFGVPRRGDYDVGPRSLRTPFANEWLANPGEAGGQAEELRGRLVAKLRDNTIHDLVPSAGRPPG